MQKDEGIANGMIGTNNSKNSHTKKITATVEKNETVNNKAGNNSGTLPSFSYSCAKMKKVSLTNFMREWRRLKLQQKFLEFNQTKLLADNFIDLQEANNQEEAIELRKMIDDIATHKQELQDDLQNYRKSVKNALTEMRELTEQLEAEMALPNHFHGQYAENFRQRALYVEEKLERLCLKNYRELNRLQLDCITLEKSLNKMFK